MKISVIIPTYKPQGYLWECLDSVRRQTLDHCEFELVLVLNGCSEPYKTDIEAYIAENMADMNVRFLQTDEPGVSNARNIGLDNASGEYITFIDDDDFVSPTYLEELLAHATPEVVSLCYPLSFIDGTDDFVPYYITRDYLRYHMSKNASYRSVKRFFAGAVYKLIHRDIIGDRRFNLKFDNGEDSLFMFLISNRLKNVNFAPETAVYFRRIRKGSATYAVTFKDRAINNFKIIREYTRIYFSSPKSYSFPFYFSRISGALKTIIKG